MAEAAMLTINSLAAAAEGPLISQPVVIFALVMVMLLVAPLVFERLKAPGLIGLIVAGIIVGPHGVGLLEREGLFDLLGDVGLVYLMFLAGLEISLRQFNRQRRDSLIFGSLTFLIPQIGGAILAWMLFDFSWPAAILLASMFASHTLVSYPIALKLGISKSRTVLLAIGGTILTDTAALLVLAVVAETARSELAPLFIVRMLLMLAVLVVGTLGALPRVGNWFFRSAEPDGAAEFAFVLSSCFVIAALAGWAGFEPILGAFLAGLALSGHVPENSVLMSRLQFTGQALLIPFFLLSVGMRVDLAALMTETRGWAVAGFMSAAVIASKWSAARLSGKLLHLTRDQSHLLFGLSVNQAAATLAAVLVGLRVGLFDDFVLNGAILMILATCIIGPWLTDRHGRRLSLAQPMGLAESAEEPPQRILIPMDTEATAGGLMDFALLLRQKGSHEPLYPLNVANEEDQSRVAAAERVLAPAVLQAVAGDAPVQVATRIDPNTASGILRAAREVRASTIIMGWSGRSAARNLVFQTISDHVIEHSRQEIFICRFRQPLNNVQRVVLLVPPLIERQPDLVRLLRDIRRLAVQENAAVLVAAVSNTLRHVIPQMQERPKVDYQVLEIDDWRAVPSNLQGRIRPTDGIMLLSVRRARLAWQPRLERVPRELSQMFPDNNLVVAYSSEPDGSELFVLPTATVPAEPAGEGASAAAMGEMAAALPPPPPTGPAVNVVLAGQGEASYPQRLTSLLRQLFADEATAGRIAAEVARIEPIELAAGAVLLHAHVAEVEGSVVLVGAGPQGVEVPGAGSRAHVLFVLLSGRFQPAADHLRSLAAVASLARVPQLVSRMAAAGNETEARRALSAE